MIEVRIQGQPRPGVFAWRAAWDGRIVEGRSREPLLDACRELKRMGVEPLTYAGLFWPGRPDWALRTRIGTGADLTTEDGPTGSRFRRFRPFALNTAHATAHIV
jgi:hypothetical protein